MNIDYLNQFGFYGRGRGHNLAVNKSKNTIGGKVRDFICWVGIFTVSELLKDNFAVSCLVNVHKIQ